MRSKPAAERAAAKAVVVRDFVKRRAAALVAEALTDTRVVLVSGARQVGKSTLVTRLVDLPGARSLTLDDPATLAVARSDPAGVVPSTAR